MTHEVKNKYPVWTLLKDKYFNEMYRIVGHHGLACMVQKVDDMDTNRIIGKGTLYEYPTHMEMFYNVVAE